MAMRDMVLRRPPQDGEDPFLYKMSQPGPYLPFPDIRFISIDGIRVLVQNPQGVDSGRLIVFSHGALVDPRSYRRMIDHWASHGFVVAAPIHNDGLFERGLETRQFDAVGSGRWEVEEVMNDVAAWKNRVFSCSIVLDRISLVANTIDMKIEVDRPLIYGHEYGAYTAALALGMQPRDAKGDVVDLLESRWYAGCLMAPQGPGIMGIDQGSFAEVSKPFAMIQGGKYEGFIAQDPKARVEGFSLAPAGNKHLIWASDSAEDVFFGPLAGTNEGNKRAFEDILAMTAIFATAYGDYDEEAFARLAGDWMRRATYDRLLSWYR